MKTEADRINVTLTDEARDGLRTIISLDGFLALKGEARAARWRMLDRAGKFQLVAQAIERQGFDWMPSDVDAQIAKYDERYASGPVELAVAGALERLAIEHSNAARLADRLGDMPHRKAERAAATAFTNALVQYKAGVRPELLPSGAWLVPSSTAGKPAHIISMDGDWICNCAAGANMHWPLALIIGIEGAQDDMQAHDDGDVEELERLSAEQGAQNDGGDPHSDPATAQTLSALRSDAPNPIPHASEAAQWLHGQQLLAQRLAATAQYIATLREAQHLADPQHITNQARAAYARANQPSYRRPLFADRDAETFRRQALAEERAELLEMRARRTALRSDPPGPNPEDDSPGDEPPVWPEDNGRHFGVRLVQARKKSAYFASAFYLEAA